MKRIAEYKVTIYYGTHEKGTKFVIHLFAQ